MQSNKVTAVIGAQYGDEGKGKIVDFLSKDVDYVMRFNGSGNAGHCVELENGERFKVHLIPAGVYNPGTLCGTTAGMLINPDTLINEIRSIEKYLGQTDTILIDPNAQVVTSYHIYADQQSELALAKQGNPVIGTTGTGNGPAYADKVTRRGIKLHELINSEEYLSNRLRQSHSYNSDLIDSMLAAKTLCMQGKFLMRYFTDMSEILNRAIDLGESILFAGAHGTFLDIDHGDYPFVTSSSCTVGGVGASGVSPTRLTEVIGCVKAYTTRSGKGPMPGMSPEIAEIIGKRAHEFGTTTGRKRRIGWIDLEMIHKASMLNQFTSIAITMLDVLSGLEIELVDWIQKNKSLKIPRWETNLRDIREYKDLPGNTRWFIELIEEAAGVPASLISVGPKRNQIIDRR